MKFKNSKWILALLLICVLIGLFPADSYAYTSKNITYTDYDNYKEYSIIEYYDNNGHLKYQVQVYGKNDIPSGMSVSGDDILISIRDVTHENEPFGYRVITPSEYENIAIRLDSDLIDKIYADQTGPGRQYVTTRNENGFTGNTNEQQRAMQAAKSNSGTTTNAASYTNVNNQAVLEIITSGNSQGLSQEEINKKVNEYIASVGGSSGGGVVTASSTGVSGQTYTSQITAGSETITHVNTNTDTAITNIVDSSFNSEENTARLQHEEALAEGRAYDDPIMDSVSSVLNSVFGIVDDELSEFDSYDGKLSMCTPASEWLYTDILQIEDEPNAKWKDRDELSFVYIIAWTFLVLISGSALFMYVWAYANDQKNSSIFEIIGRFVLAVALIVFAREICIDISKIFQNVTDMAGQLKFNITAGGDNGSVYESGLGINLLGLIFHITVFWEYCKLQIELVERYIIGEMLKIFSPAIACTAASRNTVTVFRKGLQMFIVQELLISLSFFFVAIASELNGQFMSSHSLTLAFAAIAIMKVFQKFDEHLRSMGLSVAQSGGELFSAIVGAMAAMRGFTRLGSGITRTGASLAGAPLSKSANLGLRTVGERFAAIGNKGIVQGSLTPIDSAKVLGSALQQHGGMSVADKNFNHKNNKSQAALLQAAQKSFGGDQKAFAMLPAHVQKSALFGDGANKGLFDANKILSKLGYAGATVTSASIGDKGVVNGIAKFNGKDVAFALTPGSVSKGGIGVTTDMNGRPFSISAGLGDRAKWANKPNLNFDNISRDKHAFTVDSGGGRSSMSAALLQDGSSFNDKMLLEAGAKSWAVDNNGVATVYDGKDNIIYKAGLNTGNEIFNFDSDAKGNLTVNGNAWADYASDNDLSVFQAKAESVVSRLTDPNSSDNVAPYGYDESTVKYEEDKGSVSFYVHGKDSSQPDRKVVIALEDSDRLNLNSEQVHTINYVDDGKKINASYRTFVSKNRTSTLSEGDSGSSSSSSTSSGDSGNNGSSRPPKRNVKEDGVNGEKTRRLANDEDPYDTSE